MRLPGSSQADPSRLRIANVDSLDCRRLAKLPRRLRYSEMRDDEDEASMVDSCTTILPSLSLFPFSFSPYLLFAHFLLSFFAHPFPLALSFYLYLFSVLTSSPFSTLSRAHSRSLILGHSFCRVAFSCAYFARLLFFNSHSLTRHVGTASQRYLLYGAPTRRRRR